MNTFMNEKRTITQLSNREAAARRQKIVEANTNAYHAASMVLAGLKKLQAAHKEIEIRTGQADHAYYNLIDGQPGTAKIQHLKAMLKAYREAVKPWELS